MGIASINGVALNYRLSGAEGGSPLILVNSLGTDLAIWNDVLPLLTPRHRVLTYDKRGHGFSETPPGPYSIDDHVADLLALADHCGFSSFALCGISIGGMIALRLAGRQPRRVQKLVLCDTGVKIGTAETWNNRIAQVQQDGMAGIAGTVLERWLSPDFRDRRPAEFARWRKMLESCPAEGYVASCAAVRDADLSADLARISVPTLAVFGEHDIVTPPDLAQQLADAIPGAKRKIIRHAGHVPAIERPEELGALIRDFLNEVVHV
jgi:3-oxoadipate enol-lactonase